MKLSLKLIKSFIPSEYFDASKLNGACLTKNSYHMFCGIKGVEYFLRTNSDNPLLKILGETFEVTYVGHWYWHYSEYTIRSK